MPTLIDKLTPKPPRQIGIIPNDVIGTRMAGPGIRCWEFARVLSRAFAVNLIVPPFVNQPDEAVTTASTAWRVTACRTAAELRRQASRCDVLITLGAVPMFYPFLSRLGKPLVIDLYPPFMLEDLQYNANAPRLDQVTAHQNLLDSLRVQMTQGDFFIAASEKQRDYWLGTLSMAGRVNPYTYQADPTLRRLIDVIPIGLPPEPPRKTRPVLKGVHPHIKPTDKVVLWLGGVWDWFDPLTLVKAMAQIAAQRGDVKLLFLGGIHQPNQIETMTQTAAAAMAYARQNGLLDTTVFFEGWVPYDERANYLLEADVGACLYLDHIETRFSFRTRLLDYLWAGLPVVVTQGDTMSETLATHELAYLVAPQDVTGAAQTILRLLDTPDLRASHAPRFQEVAPRYQWPIISQPLIDFCRQPSLAPDKPHLAQTQARGLLGKSRRAVQLGGVSGLLRQTRDFLRWRFGESTKGHE